MKVEIEILTALIAAAVAVVSAAITILGQFRLAKLKASLVTKKETRDRQREAEELISQYREPLAHATYDLQSKLFNILSDMLLQSYYVNGDESEREYTMQNTIYVVAQYLCWREIIRQELQFLDLGEVQSTRRLMELTDAIQKTFLTDDFDPIFRMFRGEQRAIGEKMLVYKNGHLSCMGYATFVEKQDDSFRKWFRKIENDIATLASQLPEHNKRLVELQHALIDLLNDLDPDCVRFQKQYREKYTGPVKE